MRAYGSTISLRALTLRHDGCAAQPTTSLSRALSTACYNSVRHPCCVNSAPNIVGADDVRSLQDQSGFSRQGTVKTLGNLRVFTDINVIVPAIARKHPPNKCL